MARIQIVPLPTVKTDGNEHTPFIVILDKLEDGLLGENVQAYAEHVKQTTGAALVIVAEDEWEVPGQLELTDEQRQSLLDYLSKPATIPQG